MGKRKPKEESAEAKALRKAEEQITLLRLCLNDAINGVQPFASETTSDTDGTYVLQLFAVDGSAGGRLLVTYTSKVEGAQRPYTSAHYLEEYTPPPASLLYLPWHKLLSARNRYFNSPEYFAKKGA